MPEPLKGKENHHWFHKHHVKSAVEWFWIGFMGLYKDYKKNYITLEQFRRKVRELKDEAFEGVSTFKKSGVKK